jgi:translocator assembly and maintenance protein 41
MPDRFVGSNSHVEINRDFEQALGQILGQFWAPIRYAFAYGSGIFGQMNISGGGGTGTDWSPHPRPPKAVEEWQKSGAKIINFIFGVGHTQNWHSLNLTQHPSHYNALKYLPYASAVISRIQDSLGAGVYLWRTLYLASRLQKPVKFLRDDPHVRLASPSELDLRPAHSTAYATRALH